MWLYRREGYIDIRIGVNGMQYRTEKDTIGEIQVEADKMWGAQTQRSVQNFEIGTERMPHEVVMAFAQLKKATAKANHKLGKLSEAKMKAIELAANEVIEGKWNDHFPLVVWQTGSGTQSNMNMNEVLARRGNEILAEQNSEEKLHPNEDVHMSQRSNGTWRSGMHVAGVLAVTENLGPAGQKLKATLDETAQQFDDVIKIGRTHLQGATPLTLGQEISGWR